MSAVATHPFDERQWRAIAVARPALLALIVALTAAAGYGVTAWWWLVALALIVLAASIAQRALPHAWLQAIVEITAAAVVVGLGMRESYLGLPYLLLPAFAAGLVASLNGAALCTVAGTLGLLLGLILPPTPLEGAMLVSLAPWVPMILAISAVGAWVRRQTLRPPDVTRYGAAYRLLSELRVVSRQLSGGLDPVTLATGLLDEVSTAVDAHRAVLLVRRESEVLLPLAQRGGDDGWLARVERDQRVLGAWAHGGPTNAAIGRRGHRLVLPLRVGLRTTGVVVADVDDPLPAEELAVLARATDDGALRLETALLFDEVREIATREERMRLAREIHDGIAQELASLGYLIDELQARARGADIRSLTLTLRKEVTRILSDLRHSIFDLRSDVPADVGLGTAIAGYARQVGAQTGLTVHLVHEESQERLRPEVEAELLRIGQEAITNVRKHAKARNLWVTVRVNPPVARVHVEDDGVGLANRPRDRFGLDIMAERARRVGATLVIENRPEGGTVVDVSLGADGKR